MTPRDFAISGETRSAARATAGADGQAALARIVAHRPWKQFACAAAVLAILMLRVPDYWRTGEFVAEDGWVFFADQWNHPALSTLLLPYAGYFHLLPRLVAAIWSALPLPSQPYAFAFTGLVVNAAILSAFYLPAFRRAMPSDAGRLVVVLCLALAPNAENLGLVLGLHWYLAFGLTLLLIAAPPASTIGKAAVLLAIVIAVWSTPAALVLLPFAALGWRRSGGGFERLQSVVLIASLLLVAALIAVLRVELPVRTGPFNIRDLGPILDHLVLRGWIGVGLLGPRLAARAVGAAPLVVDVGAGLVLAALGWLLWRNRRRDFCRPAAIVFGSALLMILLSLARTLYLPELAQTPLPRHVRYLTAPTLLLYVGAGIALSAVWPHLRRRLLWCLSAAVVALLSSGLPGQIHWSRPVTWFRLRDALPAIESLERQYARDHQPASLYIPSDVPYWGPVLEVGGGQLVPPTVPLATALAATPRSDGGYAAWLGPFTVATNDGWIEHASWGRLQFTGIEQGRVFFRDGAGRLRFTSALLYPRMWMLDHYDWTLLQPATRITPSAGARN